MQFIKITNEANFVNRLFLEKLGVSTKRDNEDTIGQFGSGSKFAPIAALRKGIRWISVGEDEIGPYELEFVVKEEGDINCIYALYDGVDMRPTSFTLEAGMLSWEDDFQIFREAFANALDEFNDSGAKYTIDIVDDIKFEAGKFSVYISATDEMLKIIDEIDYYFSLNRKVIHEGERFDYKFKILDRDKWEDLLVYCKGVLVFEGEQIGISNSLFSYDIPSLTLNEERRVRYSTSIADFIGAYIFPSLRDDNDDCIEIASKILQNDGREFFELEIYKSTISEYEFYGDNGSAFKAAWENMYGENACAFHLQSKIADIDTIKSNIKLHEMKPISVKSESLYKILGLVGVLTAENVLGDKVEYDFIDLPKTKQGMFDRAIEVIAKYDSKISVIKNFKFYLPKGSQDSILGIAKKDELEIYLSINNFTKMETLIGTIVHELDHIINDWPSHDAAFRSFADDRIGELLVKLNEEDGGDNE
jgi:hypothetical protein